MRNLFAALLLAAAPIAAEAAQNEMAEPQAESTPAKKDAFDLAQVMAMFDKVFPAQPEPAPGRLALAQVTASGVLPSGTYAAIFDEFMGGMVDRILALNPAEFAKGGKDKQANGSTLRQTLAKKDPHFEERMRIMQRVIGEELVKLSTVIEPGLRDGLARSIARRFDEPQLKDINAFLTTASGKAFAGQTMRMWIDPDVMRGMIQTVPHMITAMPGAMARLEAATAHLPKPKKKAEPEPEEADEAPDES